MLVVGGWRWGLWPLLLGLCWGWGFLCLLRLLTGSGFSDIDEAGPHRGSVEALAADGVLAGTECRPGVFCPRDPVRRWVMAVWLVRVIDGGDPDGVGASRFADVDAGEWWVPHVERLAELGITAGCATGPLRFCPSETVTRDQMASFLVRAFGLGEGPSSGFVDIEDNVHASNIDVLAAVGVTAGCSTSPARYCPGRDTTRGQMATFLSRALQLGPSQPVQPPEGGGFATVSSGNGFSCGIRADGTVACWGGNWDGQAAAPQEEFSAVSAGDAHSCGLLAEGTVVCWGENRGGLAEPPKGEFSVVSAGYAHSCGIRTDGTVACWGANWDGQVDAPEGKFSAVSAGETLIRVGSVPIGRLSAGVRTRTAGLTLRRASSARLPPGMGIRVGSAATGRLPAGGAG